jgi:hypothetical protein
MRQRLIPLVANDLGAFQKALIILWGAGSRWKSATVKSAPAIKKKKKTTKNTVHPYLNRFRVFSTLEERSAYSEMQVAQGRMVVWEGL